MMLVCAAIGRALLVVLETEPERVIQSGAYAIGRASTYEIFHIYAIRIAAVFMTFGLHDNAANVDWPAAPHLSRLCVGAGTFVWRRNI